MWNLFKKKPPEVILVDKPKPPEVKITTSTCYLTRREGNYYVRIKRTITTQEHPHWPYPIYSHKDKIVPFDFESDLELVPEWTYKCT